MRKFVFPALLSSIVIIVAIGLAELMVRLERIPFILDRIHTN